MLSIDHPTQRITLPDGRSLAYAEYGHAKGKPIFFLHGTPGSRLLRHPDESTITSLDIRLITSDRPGFGLSDFQPDRKILDWPDDLLRLADALGLGRFGIVGYSGGGPHAAACALRIPDRLNGVALVSSPSSLDTTDATAGMVWLNRVLFGLARDSYSLSKLSWWLMHAAYNRNPNAFMDFLGELSPESERTLLKQPDIRAMLIEDFAEANRHGTNGTAWEIVLLARDWGFRPEDISLEIDIWQGAEDVRTPLSMGKALETAIPHSRAHFLPGEGHDVLYRHWQEIMLSVLSRDTEDDFSMERAADKKRRPRPRKRVVHGESHRDRTRRSRSQAVSSPTGSSQQTELVSAAPSRSGDDKQGT